MPQACQLSPFSTAKFPRHLSSSFSYSTQMVIKSMAPDIFGNMRDRFVTGHSMLPPGWNSSASLRITILHPHQILRLKDGILKLSITHHRGSIIYLTSVSIILLGRVDIPCDPILGNRKPPSRIRTDFEMRKLGTAEDYKLKRAWLGN